MERELLKCKQEMRELEEKIGKVKRDEKRKEAALSAYQQKIEFLDENMEKWKNRLKDAGIEANALGEHKGDEEMHTSSHSLFEITSELSRTKLEIEAIEGQDIEGRFKLLSLQMKELREWKEWASKVIQYVNHKNCISCVLKKYSKL